MSESKPFAKGSPPFELGEKFAEGHMATVFEHKKDPNYLVKRVAIITEDPFSPGKETKKSYSLNGFRFHYQRNLLDMQKHVGDFMPKTQLIYGHDEEGNPTGWIITEKVFKRDDESSEDKLKALDTVMSALIDMYLNKFEKEGRDYGTGLKLVEMPDFLGSDGGEDLIYGYTKNNPTPQYYLPDIYPMFECGPIRLINEIRNKIRPYGYEHFPITTGKLVRLEELILPTSRWEVKA